MASIQKQIMSLFAEQEMAIREIVSAVLEIEQANIHLERPRIKDLLVDVVDSAARETLKGAAHED
jgi:hypothetical protein